MSKTFEQILDAIIHQDVPRTGEKHYPSDKRMVNRKAFRFVEDRQGNTIPVIHGSLDSKLGKINNKLFLELQKWDGVK